MARFKARSANLALYAYPLLGALGEQHCRKTLLSIGFEGVLGWECCFLHRELKVESSAYVGDFKMAGTPAAVDRAWKMIKKVINLDDPTPFKKCWVETTRCAMYPHRGSTAQH